ncbi:MAG: hypothetical protein AAB250_09315, partial [Bdellovibrionota bacterium]
MQRTYSRQKRDQQRIRSRWESSAPFIASGVGLVFVALLAPMNPSRAIEPRIFSQGISISVDHS